MDRITLHVPETLNDASLVGSDRFEAYEDELLDISLDAKRASSIGEEGFTVLLNVVGGWRSPAGATYREPLRLYWLDVGDAETVLDRVRRLAERIRVELAQQAVYVTVAPIAQATVTEYVAA